MFDPLDLYTPKEDGGFEVESKPVLKLKESTVVEKNTKYESTEDVEVNEDGLIDVLDLPSARYSSPRAILCVLLLLKPENQVNFRTNYPEDDIVSVTKICDEKGIDQEILSDLVNYYTKWNNPRLNSELKVCTKIPMLVNSSKELIMKYYTSLLKHFQERIESDPLMGEIVKQLSMRISEKCGRSAQPAMSRKFRFSKLDKVIEIFEPSLTADNLGWKTWGSSFVLSQKLVENMKTQALTRNLRVLELGSGTGLAGISWITKWQELNGNSKGIIKMFLTDLPEIVSNLQRNVDANDLGDSVDVCVLDWTNTKSFEEKFSSEKYDIIIVSDPIYSPDHPKLIVDMLTRFLSTDGTCFLEIPVRDKYMKEREILWHLLKTNDLQLSKQTLDEEMEDWGIVKYLYQEIRWSVQ